MSSCCQCAAPAASSGESSARAAGWVRIAVAAAVAAQSMIFSLAVNLSPPNGDMRLLVHAALAISSLTVFALLGGPLLRAAASAAFHGRLVFEQLFLAGIVGAFAASLVSTLTGAGSVYYEIVAILLAIETLGRATRENRRRAALDAAHSLGREFETCERVEPDDTIVPTPVRLIHANDLVHVAAGGNIPIDGFLVTGSALVDESTLTGDAFPVMRRPGDPVRAGSRLVDGPIRVRATIDGADRILDALFARVHAAQSRPARLQREADRLAAWFLPLVMAVSALTFVGWTLHSGWTAGLFNALAVILVACPCSMGIATPIGVWSTLADLARMGIIAGTSDLVERLAQVEQVVFDKTGTLGEERLEMVDFVTCSDTPREALLSEVAAIEAASGHPIASAFRPWAGAGTASEIESLPGAGIAGRIGDARLRIGNFTLLSEDSRNALAALRAGIHGPDGATRELYVLRNGRLAAIAILRERLRESSRAVIAELETAGIPCSVLTGDQPAAAHAHGFRNFEAGLNPIEKAERIRALSARGRVLFVGDGVNDAPALAEAHASLALASGSPVARETAMGELLALRTIPAALARCRAGVRAIRQNLLFAAGYNLIGITLAAAGLLHPVAAALLMLVSSLTVSWRALRPVSIPGAQSKFRPEPLAGMPGLEPA